MRGNPVMDADAFWARLDRSNPDACWEWASVCKGGYGYVTYQGKQWRAHRLAYTLACAPIPEGREWFICHRCDNPACCNPAHLFLGTAYDNNRDTVAKGRHVSRPGRLTAEQVRDIRSRYVRGQGPKLAAEFGISQNVVTQIVRGEMYPRIPRDVKS